MCRAHNKTATIHGWAVPTLRLRTPSSLAHRGFTLIELLLAMLVMAMVIVALAALTKGVQLANDYGEGYGTATQHAQDDDRTHQPSRRRGLCQVALSGRMGHARYRRPMGLSRHAGDLESQQRPANPSGPPLVQELLIFCPDPAVAGSFVQLNVPGDTRTVPTTTPATLNTFIDSLKTSSTANKVQLTNLLRMAVPSGTTSSPARA